MKVVREPLWLAEVWILLRVCANCSLSMCEAVDIEVVEPRRLLYPVEGTRAVTEGDLRVSSDAMARDTGTAWPSVEMLERIGDRRHIIVRLLE